MESVLFSVPAPAWRVGPGIQARRNFLSGTMSTDHSTPGIHTPHPSAPAESFTSHLPVWCTDGFWNTVSMAHLPRLFVPGQCQTHRLSHLISSWPRVLVQPSLSSAQVLFSLVSLVGSPHTGLPFPMQPRTHAGWRCGTAHVCANVCDICVCLCVHDVSSLRTSQRQSWLSAILTPSPKLGAQRKKLGKGWLQACRGE